MTLRDQIKAASDLLESEIVPVPEWDCTLTIKAMSGRQRDQLELTASKAKETGAPADIRARYIVACAFDNEGNPVFKAEDVSWLTHKSAKVLDPLFEACLRVNGIREQDVDGLEKNLESGQSDDSGSS